MPTIITINGLKFYFYSNDHEPIHVHVSKGGAEAKVILVPKVKLDSQKGFSPRAIKEILKFVEKEKELLIDQWKEYFDV